MSDDQSEQRRRSLAERVVLGASSAIVAIVVALILVQSFGGEDPAEPVVATGRIHKVGELFHVEVTARNEGELTAANLQVQAELDLDGQTYSADQTIDFLAGGADQDLVFIFEDDPERGDLTVSVTGFTVP